MAENIKITVRGFTTSNGKEDAVWRLRSGAVNVVFGATESARHSLLDSLAGRKKKSGIAIEIETSEGSRLIQGLPSPAVLPAPGDEVFVGTTVGEQLDFYSRSSGLCSNQLSALDKKFEFGFSDMKGRSVWELGAGERRCLLLVSQALASPRSWIMHSPLERLDGPRQHSMLEFISECTAQNALVVAASANPERFLGSESSNLLILGGTMGDIVYQGQAGAAGKYLTEMKRQRFGKEWNKIKKNE